jgi:UDP-N-acetyl-2-amino-2-deoxyglucuronate dehydrogenase
MHKPLIKVGIIGLGVGEAHLRSYQEIQNVEVKSICDIDKTRLEEVGKKYDIEHRYTDFKEITEDQDINVVSICSYDDCHFSQILSAIRHDKHIMVEKPACLTVHEAEEILNELQKTKIYMTSNLILRQSPRFISLRDMIKRGDFGDVFHIEGDYLHQILWKITEGWRGKMDFYCTVYGGGIHLIDLMRWIMGEEISAVGAMGSNVAVRDTSYSWPDTITALLQWKNGATGKTTTTFAPQRTKFHSLNVYGTNKTFINDMPHAHLFSGDDHQRDHQLIDTAYPGMDKGDLLPDFIDCIRQHRQPTINEIDIFRVMSVCFAIWESVQSKRQTVVQYLI